MRAKFHTLDVFTDRVFGGNPLAVFPDAGGIAPETMQAIARELNLSETVFVLPPDDPAHARRLREIYRSAGWPVGDAIEIDLLAAGLLQRVQSAAGHETLRVTDAGTIIRTADAAGADGVILAGDSVDAYNPKTVRASVGSLFHLPFAIERDPDGSPTGTLHEGAADLVGRFEPDDTPADLVTTDSQKDRRGGAGAPRAARRVGPGGRDGDEGAAGAQRRLDHGRLPCLLERRRFEERIARHRFDAVPPDLRHAPAIRWNPSDSALDQV